MRSWELFVEEKAIFHSMDMTLEMELWKFHDIFFDEATHSYTDSLGTEYTSVTKFVHQFSPEQDWDEIARKYVRKHNYDDVNKKLEKIPEPAAWPGQQGSLEDALPLLEKRALIEAAAIVKVRAEWDQAGTKACALGTEVHAYMENQWKRKLYRPEKEPEGYEELSAVGLRAYTELSKRFVPIREEFIVCKPEWQLCGTIDFLAYDMAKDRIVILDYKTNKEIKRENPFQQCVGALAGLPDCNYITYCAQLSTYKAILEAETSIRIGGMALVHIRKDGYSVIPCKDLSAQIKEHLDGKQA